MKFSLQNKHPSYYINSLSLAGVLQHPLNKKFISLKAEKNYDCMFSVIKLYNNIKIQKNKNKNSKLKIITPICGIHFHIK